MADPQFVVSPQDVQKLWTAASSIGNPLSLAQRIAGLGETEQRAGVPTWAWIVVAVGVGAVAGVHFGPQITSFLRRRGSYR
jgi:hypothetical protein